MPPCQQFENSDLKFLPKQAEFTRPEKIVCLSWCSNMLFVCFVLSVKQRWFRFHQLQLQNQTGRLRLSVRRSQEVSQHCGLSDWLRYHICVDACLWLCHLSQWRFWFHHPHCVCPLRFLCLFCPDSISQFCYFRGWFAYILLINSRSLFLSQRNRYLININCPHCSTVSRCFDFRFVLKRCSFCGCLKWK